jgi:hypothetical protein
MFWSVYYKGFYIHGNAQNTKCYVNTDNGPGLLYLGNYKTLLGAKRAITKFINK